MQSVLGTILDPAADKTLVTTLVVTLTMKGLIPRTRVILITFVCVLTTSRSASRRDHNGTRRPAQFLGVLHSLYLPPSTCALIISLYRHFLTENCQKTFARYWDFSIPSAEVHPTQISKVRRTLQRLVRTH